MHDACLATWNRYQFMNCVFTAYRPAASNDSVSTRNTTTNRIAPHFVTGDGVVGAFGDSVVMTPLCGAARAAATRLLELHPVAGLSCGINPLTDG